MTKEFKYTTEERFNEFYLHLHNNLLEETPVEAITKTDQLNTMISMRYKPVSWSEERALKTMECLLYLFEDYEEYEYCQSIIDAWPELKFENV